MSADGSLVETRLALVHLRAMELGLFEALGGFVQRAVEPELKLLLAAHSRLHGEHWLALGGLLPAGPAPLREEAANTPTTLAAVYHEVLPEVMVAYGYLLAALDAVRGAPVRRVVEAILADYRRQQADGVRLLAALGDRKELGVSASNQSGRGARRR